MEELEDRSEEKPCKACQLPAKDRRFHWFYSFSSADKLFQHLAEQGISTSEEYRRKLARWYAECEEIVHTQECRPERWSEKTEHLRKWTLLARSAKTPDELDALAAELLSPDAAESAKFWTRLWRKHLKGGKLTRNEQDEIDSWASRAL